MELSVLIRPNAPSGFRASCGDPLPAEADGPTRQNALDNLRAVLSEKLRGGVEVVRLRVSPAPSPDPIWPDDELTRNWLQGIAEARAAADYADPS